MRFDIQICPGIFLCLKNIYLHPQIYIKAKEPFEKSKTATHTFNWGLGISRHASCIEGSLGGEDKSQVLFIPGKRIHPKRTVWHDKPNSTPEAKNQRKWWVRQKMADACITQDQVMKADCDPRRQRILYVNEKRLSFQNLQTGSQAVLLWDPPSNSVTQGDSHFFPNLWQTAKPLPSPTMT